MQGQVFFFTLWGMNTPRPPDLIPNQPTSPLLIQHPPPLSAEIKGGNSSANDIVEVAHDSPEGMTVLVARDTGSGVPVMAKTWSAGESGLKCRPYDHAWLFLVHTVSVASFALLCAVLAALKNKMHACVIRGQLLPHADGQRTTRQCVDRDGKIAPFAECLRAWVLLDFDHFMIEEFPDPIIDPLACVWAVRERLPAGLRDVAFFWSFSSSTGLKPGKLGIHLYLLLGKPLGWRDIEAFIFACGADVAMSRTVQVHYTAQPVLLFPLTDPLPRRFGALKGIERVPVDVMTALVALGHQKRSEGRAMKQAPARTSPAPMVISVPRTNPTLHDLSSKADESVSESAPGMIGDGNRHSHLTSMAGFGRSRGLEVDGLRAVLVTENQCHCFPPLDQQEAEAMAESYARYAVTKKKADPWVGTVIMVAGLMRHNACEEACVVAATHMLGEVGVATEIVALLYELPLWQLQGAENQPDLFLDRAAEV